MKHFYSVLSIILFTCEVQATTIVVIINPNFVILAADSKGSFGNTDLSIIITNIYAHQ